MPRPNGPEMSSSTAVPRAGRFTTSEFVAVVFGVVPTAKNSTSAVVGAVNDGLKIRTSLMNV